MRAPTILVMKMLLKHLLMTAALPVVVAEKWTAETIATGLDNPRGVAVAPDGSVYVAESGSGGSNWNYDLVSGGPPGLFCSGPTGGITKIEFGEETVATSRLAITTTSRLDVDFPSVAGPETSCEPPPLGFAATGPSSLAIEDDGSIILAMGMGGFPDNQDIIGEVFGSLYRVVGNTIEDEIANIPAYVASQSDLMQSNPYGIALVPQGVLVADAGADALFLVRNDSSVETIDTVIAFRALAKQQCLN
jgi:DNA-binding beta-propeller fold protein YncE